MGGAVGYCCGDDRQEGPKDKQMIRDNQQIYAKQQRRIKQEKKLQIKTNGRMGSVNYTQKMTPVNRESNRQHGQNIFQGSDYDPLFEEINISDADREMSEQTSNYQDQNDMSNSLAMNSDQLKNLQESYDEDTHKMGSSNQGGQLMLGSEIDDFKQYRSGSTGNFSVDKKFSEFTSLIELKNKAMEEISKIHNQDGEQVDPDDTTSGRFKIKFSDYLMEMFDVDNVDIKGLDLLRKKENGRYMQFRGSEYEDQEYQNKKNHVILYLRNEPNNIITGIEVCVKNEDETNFKPHLFKIISGIRFDNQFFLESRHPTSSFSKGFAGYFGFKNGQQTLEGRVIDVNFDLEQEYVFLNSVNK